MHSKLVVNAKPFAIQKARKESTNYKLNPYANLSDRICFEFAIHSLNFEKVNEINDTKL